MSIFEAVCLTLWWTEGTKLRVDKRWGSYNYSVEITNTNPEIIYLFLKYVRVDLGIQNERIRIQLQIHLGDDQEEYEQFWSEQTGIPRSQFNKTIVRPVGNKIGKSTGTCKIRIYSKELYLLLDQKLTKLRGVVHR